MDRQKKPTQLTPGIILGVIGAVFVIGILLIAVLGHILPPEQQKDISQIAIVLILFIIILGTMAGR